MNYMNQSRGNCSSQCNPSAGNNRHTMASGCNSCNPRNNSSSCNNSNGTPRCGNHNNSVKKPHCGSNNSGMNPHCGNNMCSNINTDCNNNCNTTMPRCNNCDANSSSQNDPLAGMPVGIGYVPWQQWSKTYDYCEGLSRGTIFPCLDLPFYGCIPRDFRCNKGGRA